jgi:hypothetical protein
MGIYKNLNPEDVSLRSFEVHKEFTFTNNDSGSSVYGIRAISGSTHNFQHSTANSQSFGTYNSISASMNKQPYLATFYEIPVYFTINNLFYRDLGVIDNTNVDLTHWEKTHSLVKGIVSSSLSDFPTRLTHNYSSRILHESASIISVPRKFYGEGIKPKSVTISDNSTDITYTLKDDGLGNLYDNNYSSSFAVASESFKSGGGGQVTGSIIGNILYDYGLVVITDTGSYKDVGNTGGDDGWEITFKSTRQIYEREVQCNVSKGEFMHSTNITLTPENKGAFGVPANLFPENETYSTNHLNLGTIWPASSSYNDEGYYGTGSLKDFVTGSDFAPYVTTIGLYDDHNDLVAIGKLAKPIKNDKELDINFVVRFDG